jgi:8-hydroxy-5-deazaflavin:NADPH oxidoreductase
MKEPLAIVGGTGAQGCGLAVRFAHAGVSIVIGSRVPERAEAAAERIRAASPGARVEGLENLAAIQRARRIVLALPFAGLQPFLGEARDALAGKLLIDVVVPLAVEGKFFALAPVEGTRSVGELIQQTVPTARVVSAFKNLAARQLAELATPLEGDVVLCGEHAEARAEVAALIGLLPGLRAVDAGTIRNARYLEAITALLLNLNRRHHACTSIRIVGLPAVTSGSERTR